jgi:hypothetical protein
MVKAREVKG